MNFTIRSRRSLYQFWLWKTLSTFKN